MRDEAWTQLQALERLANTDPAFVLDGCERVARWIIEDVTWLVGRLAVMLAVAGSALVLLVAVSEPAAIPEAVVVAATFTVVPPLATLLAVLTLHPALREARAIARTARNAMEEVSADA